MKKNMLIMMLAMVFLVTGCGKEEQKVLQGSITEDTSVKDDEDTVIENSDKDRQWDDYMASVKKQSDIIKTSLEQDPLSQADMNEKSNELYMLWDGALNDLWAELKNVMKEKEFEKLQEEQRIWISEKEKAVEEAGKDFEGGSIYPLIVSGEAAAITEERVYELYELLKEVN